MPIPSHSRCFHNRINIRWESRAWLMEFGTQHAHTFTLTHAIVRKGMCHTDFWVYRMSVNCDSSVIGLETTNHYRLLSTNPTQGACAGVSTRNSCAARSFHSRMEADDKRQLRRRGRVRAHTCAGGSGAFDAVQGTTASLPPLSACPLVSFALPAC